MSEHDPPFLLKFYMDRDLRYGDVPLHRRVTVGRGRENDVVLNHNSVSRRHATFFVEKAGSALVVLLRDEGSRNGCIVNGRPVRGTEVLVKPGDCIQLGVFLVDLTLTNLKQEAEPVDDLNSDIVLEVSPSSRTALPDERLRVLYELVAGIDLLDNEKVLPAVAEWIGKTLPFGVLYMLLEDEQGAAKIFASTPNGPCDPARISVSRSLINKCHAEGVAVLAGTSGVQSLDAEGTAIFKSLKSAMCVPFLGQSRCMGVTYASSPSERVYTREDLQVLILVTSSVTHSVEARRALAAVREEKEKIEKILGSLKEAVLLLDSDFRILRLNLAANEVFDGREVVGLKLAEALVGYRSTADLETLDGLSSFEIEEDSEASKVRDSAGVLPRIYEGKISRSDGAGSMNWRYVACLHDVSQSRHLERTKSLFVNRLAHKIITPLTVVTSVNFLVAEHVERLGDEELKRLLAQSIKESEHCSALIRQLVDYTVMNFGNSSASRKRMHCRFESLIERALISNNDLIVSKQFKVLPRIAEDATEALGDFEQLGLVFQHLVQNAVKFGCQGGSVQVSTELMGREVKVSFLDDGPGIPPGEMKNVGQMFYQFDPQNTGEVPGSGVGLWLVREIVRSHGGDVKLSSPTAQDGTGTLVELVLPAATAKTPLGNLALDPPTDTISREVVNTALENAVS